VPSWSGAACPPDPASPRYQGAPIPLLERMTPHPLATYAQMSVSPQRYRTLRRRRRAVHLLLSSSVRVPEPTLVEVPEPTAG
jgi:hypothetical protein